MNCEQGTYDNTDNAFTLSRSWFLYFEYGFLQPLWRPRRRNTAARVDKFSIPSGKISKLDF